MGKKILSISLSIFIGLVFLYSGYTKIKAIEPFEYTFVDLGLSNWQLSPFIARLFIGLELFLGFLFLKSFRLKKIALPLAIFILIFFSLYLGLQIYKYGNTGNCGCFGEHLKMTPLEGIYKNVFLLGSILLIYALGAYDSMDEIGRWFNEKKWLTLISKNAMFLILVFAFALPFTLNPVDLDFAKNKYNDDFQAYSISFDEVYNPIDTSKVQRPKVDIRHKNTFVMFMSATCPHCRIAAKKVKVIHNRQPQIPMYLFLNGGESNFNAFFSDTRLNVNWSKLNGPTFISLAGVQLPQMYHVSKDSVLHETDYYSLDETVLTSWFNDQTK